MCNACMHVCVQETQTESDVTLDPTFVEVKAGSNQVEFSYSSSNLSGSTNVSLSASFNTEEVTLHIIMDV